MRAQQVMVDANFIAKGLNVSGAPAITDSERNTFVSEAALTAGMVGTHKAADVPYLTMNDKVFAARHNLASLTPVAAEAEASPVEEEGEPEEESEYVFDTEDFVEKTE